MSRPRRFGVLLCLLGFLAVCVLAVTMSWSRPFAGLPGIEAGLEEAALDAVGDIGATADADGRDVTVALPETVPADFDRDAALRRLGQVDGIRSIEVTGGTTIELPTAVVEPTAVPAIEPTAVPEPDPTAAPEPAPEPTAALEPAPEATATAVVEPATPVPPSPADVVAAIDLAAVEFESGTAVLTAEAVAALAGAADQLRGLDDVAIEVQAHTDSTGDPDVNLLLSQDRAETVAAYLLDQGVTAELRPRGYGASRPIADNTTEQGQAANRRVALVVEGN